MADTLMGGNSSQKMYLYSELTSTIKDSISVSAINTDFRSISSNSTDDTLWAGRSPQKIYNQSGQFTSTIKDSLTYTAIDVTAQGICGIVAHTQISTTSKDKYIRLSGQFTSTIKTSGGTGIDTVPLGSSEDDTDAYMAGFASLKLYYSSGHYTSTIKDSRSISGIDNVPLDIGWDGTNTLWTGAQADKIYLQSGRFTSTLKNSLSVGAQDTFPDGVESQDFNTRMNVVAGSPAFTSAATGRVNMYWPTGRALKGKLEAADHSTATVIAWEDSNGNTYTPGVGDRFIIFDVRITNATGSNSVTIFQDDDDDNANDAGEMVYEAEFLDQGIDSHSFTQPLATAVMNAATDGLHLISTAAGETSVVILAQVLHNQN